jgi:hypothetical protein
MKQRASEIQLHSRGRGLALSTASTRKYKRYFFLPTVLSCEVSRPKTLVLAYVTIPARSRLSQSTLSSPACFAHYSVREVILRRFIPARMRD